MAATTKKVSNAPSRSSPGTRAARPHASPTPRGAASDAAAANAAAANAASGANDLSRLTRRAVAFRDERDWKQFHNPKDMALSLALETAELVELMQWRNGRALVEHLRRNREALADELSDVLYWVLTIAHDFGIDIAAAFDRKLEKSAAKYPVEKARGRSSKYTEL